MQNDNKNEHVKVVEKLTAKIELQPTGTMAHAAQVDEHNGQRGELARWQIKHGFSSIITDGSAYCAQQIIIPIGTTAYW